MAGMEFKPPAINLFSPAASGALFARPAWTMNADSKNPSSVCHAIVQDTMEEGEKAG